MAAVIVCTSAAMAMPTRVERNLAIRLFDANQLEPAVAKFAKIVDLHPSDEVSQYYLALALSRLGKTDQAYIHFTLAYLSEPDSQAGKYSKLASIALTVPAPER